jgi:hypothetical protein
MPKAAMSRGDGKSHHSFVGQFFPGRAAKLLRADAVWAADLAQSVV